jgi:hypothetical protein
MSPLASAANSELELPYYFWLLTIILPEYSKMQRERQLIQSDFCANTIVDRGNWLVKPYFVAFYVQNPL